MESSGNNKNLQRISIGDSSQLDAFNRLNVTTSKTLFEGFDGVFEKINLYGKLVASGGTIVHNNNEKMSHLNVSTTDGSRAIRQTVEKFQYVPGSSMTVVMTGVIGSGQVGTRQRIGYFDDNDGLFFEVRDGVLGVVRRTSTSGSVVEDRVPQSEFNIDKLDGTGPSGYNLDLTKNQIYHLDFQWLGTGQIRWGIVCNGELIACHAVCYANELDVPFIQTPRLPVTYEIVNTSSTSSSATMKMGCQSVYISTTNLTKPFKSSVNFGPASKSIGSNIQTPLLSIRLRDGFQRANFNLTNFTLVTDSNQFVYVEILHNTTLGGTPAWNNTNGFITEWDRAASSLSGGNLIFSGYTNRDFPLTFPPELSRLLSQAVDGTKDTITIAARTTGGNANAWIAANFEEYF